MEITTNLAVAGEEKKELARILGCTQRDVAEKLAGFSTAALHEYVSMVLGQKVFRRGTDILEYRLFLLIKHQFDNEIPDEQEVCKLFQTTQRESRTLIRSVMSKYQYALKTAIGDSVKSVLTQAQAADKGAVRTVVINSRNLVDELNRLIQEVDGTLPSVQKRRGSVSTYEIDPASYARLCEHLGLGAL